MLSESELTHSVHTVTNQDKSHRSFADSIFKSNISDATKSEG